MDKLKNHLLFGNMIAIFVLAWSIGSSRGLAAPATLPSFAPVSTTFTYEGRLGTVTGRYDFRFRLFASTTSTTPVLPTVRTLLNVPVSAGEYVVALNFGVAAFSGDARYLEVLYRVHSDDPNAPYTTQISRPQLLPVPYALGVRLPLNETTSSSSTALQVQNSGTGAALQGRSVNGASGVYGESNLDGGAGVRGKATGAVGSAGVYGQSTDAVGVWGSSETWQGVYGQSRTQAGVVGRSEQFHAGYFHASGANASGTWSYNDGGGTGITGLATSTTSGWGIYGETKAGSGWAGVRGVGTQGRGVWGSSVNSAGVGGSSVNNAGVWGRSDAGAEGVYGEAAKTGAAGVRGIASGGVGSAGVSGQSSAGIGVWGVSDTNVGVYGQSTSNHAVSGVGGGAGAGVYGSHTSGGYAMQAAGNTTQNRTAGGWVKAMAFINPFEADKIRQCFNSQLPASQASSGDCGFSIPYASLGAITLDFGFKVDDRVIVVTPLGSSGTICTNLEVPNPVHERRWAIVTSYCHREGFNYYSQSTNAPFMIVVY